MSLCRQSPQAIAGRPHRHHWPQLGRWALWLFLAISQLACRDTSGPTESVAPSASVTAADEAPPPGRFGLPEGAAAPSFMPLHLTGPHAERRACPLCVYGNRTQLQIWVQEAALERGFTWARWVATLAAPAPQAYLILVPETAGALAPATLERLEQELLGNTFAVEVPSWDDPETGALYDHSQVDQPDLRVYVVANRRVFARFDNPEPGDQTRLATALAAAQGFERDGALTDAMIAPPWEPGQPLEVLFRLQDAGGQPIVGQAVVAWQTDRSGLYNPRNFGHRIPRLQTKAWSDQKGEIRFVTIFPGAYPAGTEPAHIHFSIADREPRWCTLWFEGDPLLTPERRAWAAADQETVIVPLDQQGSPWKASHTHVLSD
jgi:protocatechuate 3,4-dioxygenase beta subunit